MVNLNNRRMLLLEFLYSDGFRFIARDGERSDSKIRAYVVKPDRMLNELQQTWDGKRMGQAELEENLSIIKGILKDIKWSDEPLDIEKEINR